MFRMSNEEVSSYASGMPSLRTDSKEEATSKLQDDLIHYTLKNDRRQVKKALLDAADRNLLSVALKPTDIPDGEEGNFLVMEAEAEIDSEAVILNGMNFSNVKSSRGRKSEFLIMFKELCETMCAMAKPQGGVKIDPVFLYDEMLVKMARNTSAAESFFKLNELLGSSELIMMPAQTSNSKTQLPPLEVEMFLSGGSINANVRTSNLYGLHRQVDLQSSKGAHDESRAKPWIGINAVVHELVNFGNNSSCRWVQPSVRTLN
eukprot:scaffold166592_cov55-Attheya_sp.AAC.1